jgi:hypothetical protein
MKRSEAKKIKIILRGLWRPIGIDKSYGKLINLGKQRFLQLAVDSVAKVNELVDKNNALCAESHNKIWVIFKY